MRKLTFKPLAVAIDERPGSEWTVNVSLAGVNVPLSDPYRVYYASPDNGVIVAYWQPTDADAGNFSINHNDNWGTVQGGFAAAAWADQVRMYYFNDGNLVVSAQDINVWAEMAPLAG